MTATAPVPLPATEATRRQLRTLISADTPPPDINGASHFAARPAEGLARRGYDVQVRCLSARDRSTVEDKGSVTLHRTASWGTPLHPTFRAASGSAGRDRMAVRARRCRGAHRAPAPHLPAGSEARSRMGAAGRGLIAGHAVTRTLDRFEGLYREAVARTPLS